MPTSDGPSRFPGFVPPPHANHQRSPCYVPGRVAPVRSPPPAKAPPPPPIKPHGPPPERRATFNVSEESQRRERAQSLQQRKNTFICFGVSMGAFFLTLILILSLTSGDVLDENCPDHNPSLSSWNPGHQPEKAVVIRRGHLFRLESSATFHSLTIQSGGQVVFADNADGSKNITLRTHHILIEDGAALHIGAPKCRYRSRATIALVGRSDNKAVPEVPGLGRKFIGVMSGGTLELHGTEAASWSLLTRSIPASGLVTGGHAFQRNFSRGINLRVVDQDTAAVLLCERYDTHDSRNDSRRLTQLLRTLPAGRIVALAVGDSAVKSLLDETKKTIEEKLGSSFVYDLKYRQAWALVSVVGGGNASCTEDVREHENHDTGGRALARRNYTTVDGVDFSVTAYSEWKNGFPISGFQVDAVDQVVLNLQDEVKTWKPGDQIVVASTDYSMHQAEEFTLLPCPRCSSRQVRIQGKPQYNHVGEIIDGVDMRAEVALLSRNILIHGEMENSCYGNNMCQFYSHDTYGGHIKISGNFSSVHLSYVELKNMGQQAEKSRYPLHFHLCGDVDQRGGYREPTYVDGLSIHHSFSRCLTIHATNGLLVKDTVGYDTLGHCFFLEDGIEQRNTFYHNLGLLTRPGTLLPTDRNETLCTSIKDKVYKGYTPSPSTECKAVSTFWIANPNNNLISNAAAGSQDAGIWFVFHSSSTGDSHGLVPETKAELTPLGIFYNNRVHSNFKAGLFIDKGVKTTNASAADPREYLCLDNSARFRPHQNADPSRPRVAAVIDTLISFKNNDLGAWIRGGDIVIQQSGFADNGVGLSFASDGSYPKDEGSSQEVTQSLFVGESRNRGTNGGQNKYWGPGGADAKMRTLPRNRTFPIRGFQIYDGPVRLTQSTFRGFIPTPERYTSAVGFNLKNTWQLTPRNNLSQVSFHSTVGLRTFFGRPGQWFEENDLDGDKNSIFHDADGSVTGYRDSYVGRADNYLIQHPRCVNVSQWSGVICSGRYSQVYIQTQGAPSLSLSISRDEYPFAPLVLRGINSQGAPSQQYQPILMMSKSYTLHWSGPAPREVVLSLINFDKNDWVLVGLCYPSDTTFQIMADINDRQSNTFDDLTDYGTVSSLAELEKRPMERKYYFDQSVGLLWLYLRARHDRDGHSYCSVKGCERVKVMATTSSKQICNCSAKAYPKYSKTPSAAVPMPALNTQPCKGCGAKQLVFSSEPWTSYLQTQVKSLCSKEQQRGDNSSFITVNEVTMPFNQPGYLLVSVDACSGKVTKKTSFAKMDAKMEQYLKTAIPKRSIVLIATRGQPEGLVRVAPYLVSFGLAKAADLHSKDSLALWGFHGGSSPPPWVSLQAGEGDEILGLQERYLPLGLEAYGCTAPAAQTRKDLELLKKATGPQ
ncbi:cell surface hyaluronidase [Larimichthys crocea]|uniref:cell surface hyaluronidase n=1 Tax=Larimichthys crocea TaxID=215358 RepID=UPI000F5E11D3|nr:cell surface hyaluronidase [Larimichthys crocea]XP_019131532.2 cell surface hyaluronidase [Larimichthys crocea]